MKEAYKLYWISPIGFFRKNKLKLNLLRLQKASSKF